MSNRICKFMSKFIWCLPVLLMMLGSLYYVNLFDNLRKRDLNRQFDEKYQFIQYVLNTKDEKDFANIITILYSLPDINTYMLDENLDRVAEKYYHQKPLNGANLPYKDQAIQFKLLHSDNGVFKYNLKPDVYMYWNYRWLNINGNKRVILIGVKNYPFDVLDAELQISIGILLLLTAMLNWILVGYGKYLYQKEKRLKLLNEGN